MPRHIKQIGGTNQFDGGQQERRIVKQHRQAENRGQRPSHCARSNAAGQCSTRAKAFRHAGARRHQHGGAGGGVLRQFLHRLPAGLHEGGAQHQVFRRIAADEQFREQDEVRILRLPARLACAGEIGVDRPERGVELGQRDDESVGHEGVLADGGQPFNCGALTGDRRWRKLPAMILKSLLLSREPGKTAIAASGRDDLTYGRFAALARAQFMAAEAAPRPALDGVGEKAL